MRLSRSPHLRNLRAFCIAAHHGSFKVAADELYLTPSAVSHQMKELEDTLGVRLFERKTRAVELTISPLLDAIERSVARVARRSRRTALRLQLPPFFASELFIPRIGNFCDAYPHIDIQVDTNDPRPSQHSPASDLSVLLSDEEPHGLEVTRLLSLSLVAACAPHHAATVSRLGSAALRELALIVHKTRPFAWNSWAQEVGLTQPEPKNVIELDSMLAVVRAAERGVGIALVPEALCRAWFESGALARVFAVQLATADAYFLVSRVKDAQRSEVRAMTQWMIEHCTRLPTLEESAGARQARLDDARALSAGSS
jgi:LysR family transcriptional regulator, glycine cleavage system transcriptional activator